MGRVKARPAELNVGLVHGRMKPAEKQAVMQSFKQGEPCISRCRPRSSKWAWTCQNSSLMIIENPERLGLAQLHQLRGRVGRGAIASHWVLLYKAPLSKTAQMRLQVLRDSNGFVIAQKIWRSAARANCWARVRRVTPSLSGGFIARSGHDPRSKRLARHIHERYPEQAAALIERWMPETERYSNA